VVQWGAGLGVRVRRKLAPDAVAAGAVRALHALDGGAVLAANLAECPGGWGVGGGGVKA
jgi:hypothetical protein